MRWLLLIIALFVAPATADVVTIQTYPVCEPNLSSLPIFPIEMVTSSVDGDGKLQFHVGIGTAFLVEPNIWVTAAHVIDDAYVTISIHEAENIYTDAEVLWIDRDVDIAILRGDSSNHQALSITNSVGVGDRIYSVGFPKYSSNTIVSFIGEIVGTTDNGFAQTSLMIGGMSGGPTLSCNLGTISVVGVNTAYFTKSTTRSITVNNNEHTLTVKSNRGGGVFTSNIQQYVDRAVGRE